MFLEFTSFCSPLSSKCYFVCLGSYTCHFGESKDCSASSKFKVLNVPESFREVEHLDYETQFSMFHKTNTNLIEPAEDMAEN